MNLSRSRGLAEKCNDSYLKQVYDIISKAATERNIAGDSEPMMIIPQSACDEISQLGYERVKENYIEKGVTFQTPEEAHRDMFLKIAGDTDQSA